MTTVKRATIKSLSLELENLKEQLKEFHIFKMKVEKLEETIGNMNKNDKPDLGNKDAVSRNKLEQIFKCKKCDKSSESARSLKKHVVETHSKEIKCKVCDKKFTKNCDLEVHLNSEHQEAKIYGCDKCEMTFVLKWRLDKHKNIHSSENLKFCHYFNNEKVCPYQKFGCMFKHDHAEQCKFKEKCANKLCQFKHKTDQQLSCEKCEYKGISKYDIENHLKMHDEQDTESIDEDEESYEGYYQEFYPEIFQKYVEAGNCIECNYCDYFADKNTLSELEEEIKNHVKENHKEIINSYDLKSAQNKYQHEFYVLFVEE